HSGPSQQSCAQHRMKEPSPRIAWWISAFCPHLQFAMVVICLPHLSDVGFFLVLHPCRLPNSSRILCSFPRLAESSDASGHIGMPVGHPSMLQFAPLCSYRSL